MRILIVQTSFLGDVILSTPVIAALKEKYTEAELWIMTTPLAQSLVRRDPLISGAITFDKYSSEKGLFGLIRKARELKSQKFDVVYALQRSFRTSLLLFLAQIPKRIGFKKAKLSFLYHQTLERNPLEHDVIRNLGIVGEKSSAKESLRLFSPDSGEIRDQIRNRVKSLQNNFVIMVPGSVWATKRWYWEHYREIAKRFRQEGLNVLLLGSKEERDLCEKISAGTDSNNLAGEISIDEMMWIVKQSKLVVCNDSMALHMASAFKIPTVAIFCATSPTFGFGPWQNRAIVMEKEGLACKPCSRHGGMSCPTGTESCMRDLKPDQIYSAAKRMLQ